MFAVLVQLPHITGLLPLTFPCPPITRHWNKKFTCQVSGGRRGFVFCFFSRLWSLTNGKVSGNRITPALHLVFVAGVLPRLVLLYRPAEGERDAGLGEGWRGSPIHTLPLWLGKSCLMWYFVLRQIVCPESKTDLKKLKLQHDLWQIKVWTRLCVCSWGYRG